MDDPRRLLVHSIPDRSSSFYEDGVNSSDNSSIASRDSLSRNARPTQRNNCLDWNDDKSDYPETIDEIPWFHKGLTRNTAEAILLTNATEGTYLLRNSGTNIGQYTISARCSDSVKHFTMAFEDGIYKFGIGQFESLEELLDHFTCLPVLGTETGGTVTLRYPYYSNVSEPHMYDRIERHAEGGRSISFARKPIPIRQPDYHIASKEGYLVKLGAIRKSWRKRWFVLKKNELKYFKTKEQTKPIRTINLESAIEVRNEDHPDKLNCFSLRLPWRTFYFYAASPREAGDWIQMLRWKLEYYAKRNNPKVSKDPLASIAR